MATPFSPALTRMNSSGEAQREKEEQRARGKGAGARCSIHHPLILSRDPPVGLGKSFRSLVTTKATEAVVFLQDFCFSFGVIPLLL